MESVVSKEGKVICRRECRNSILTAAQCAAHVAFVVALFDVVSLVKKLFPLCERDFDFDQSVAEIKLGRHNRFSSGADFRNQLADFTRVEQEFSRAIRLVVIRVPEIVFGNVCMIKNRNRTVVDTHKCIRNICPPEANCFYFRSRERNARFKAALEKIISRGLRVADFCEPRVVLFFTHKILIK